MIDYKVLIRLSHHTDSAPVWLLVTQGAHVLHRLLFLAVEPVQLLPSSLQGNVGMSNPQLICKKPQDWNLVPPTTSKRLFKLRLNVPESLFFLVWLVKCGVPMTEWRESQCIMAASALCYGSSDRLRSLAAFGLQLQLVGGLQRSNDLPPSLPHTLSIPCRKSLMIPRVQRGSIYQ